jgi:ribonuclease Z
MLARKAFWNKEYKFDNNKTSITGYSRCAFRTGFYIPKYKMMLDAGPQCFNKPEHIFITHTHSDHIANLPLTMIGDPDGNHIFKIYATANAENKLREYINASFSVNCLSDVIADDWYVFNKLYSRQNFQITANTHKLHVETFECDHTVPTLSYGFSDMSQKLKPEYIVLPGKDIAALRKQGVEVTREVAVKKFAFVCDSSIKVMDLNPNILDYPTIIIECTFITEGAEQDALNKKHIHWNQLKPYVIQHPHIQFILIHFSLQHKDEEIKEFFEKENFSNVYPWLTDIDYL